MKADIVFAGIGGQGVLSAAAILAEAARRQGLVVKQTEVHGMAQRGGAVQASLRIAPDAIASELIPRGSAQMILGLEPVEALRYIDYLVPDGLLVTAADPVADLPGYPPIALIHEQVRSLGGHLIEADRLAREAGSHRAANIVMLGAASVLLSVPPEILDACIGDAFAARGDKVVAINREAFRLGRAAIAPARR
ncbi:MAG: indolepyruvate oxidoreductase [Actinobacteria bacterium RBG_16_68_21]|nr:MAG: indolepyruvate oxidoreductase [Actinobacteria bacterium RBG_16_68_21]